MSLHSYESLDTPPDYVPSPTSGEARVSYTPLPGPLTLPPPTGVYTKKAGSVTVVLKGQQDGVSVPTYGHQALVNGELVLEKSSTITELRIKLEGKMTMLTSEGGPRSLSTTNDSYSLWKSEPSSDALCPSTVPFSFVFPSRFKDGDEEAPIPPSYDFTASAVPALIAKCQYNLVVSVTRSPYPQVGLIRTTKCMAVPVNYRPRSRPCYPVPNRDVFARTVKRSPEDCYRSSSSVKPKFNSRAEPLQIELLIPRYRSYGLRDKIPFHVRLRGATPSLMEFVSSPDTSSRRKGRGSRSPSPVPQFSAVSVFFLRQISVDVKGKKTSCDTKLAEGRIWPSSSTLDAENECLNWSGEVQCGEDITTVGGFAAGGVTVEDYLVLSLSPADPAKSAFLPFRDAVSIQFTTDLREVNSALG